MKEDSRAMCWRRRKTVRELDKCCTYVAHLSHNGLLFLTEIVLVVLGNLLVQVLVDLQHLMADRHSDEYVCMCVYPYAPR